MARSLVPTTGPDSDPAQSQARIFALEAALAAQTARAEDLEAALAAQTARAEDLEAALAAQAGRLADEALRASEARFRLLAEHAQDLIYRFRLAPTPGFEYVSPSSTAMVGYTPEDHYADPTLGLKLVHPEDQWQLQEMLASSEALAGPLTMRWQRKDGSVIWTEQVNRLIRDETGQALAIEGIARDITERKRTEEELRASAAQLQSLSQRLVEAHERERRDIARELHDEVGQVLTGLKLALAVAANVAPPALAATLADAQAAINDLMGRVRALSLNLRPALLDDLGLLPALTWLIERYTVRTGVQIDLRHQGLGRRFPTPVETAAYRTVQEALTNVARHAGVQAATVRLRAEGARLMLRVDDDGCGFDAETVLARSTTTGLSGMLERVRLLGGLLTVEAAPGEGTHIIVELPLSSQEGDQ